MKKTTQVFIELNTLVSAWDKYEEMSKEDSYDRYWDAFGRQLDITKALVEDLCLELQPAPEFLVKAREIVYQAYYLNKSHDRWMIDAGDTAYSELCGELVEVLEQHLAK